MVILQGKTTTIKTTIMEWISVKDKLPTDTMGSCLVCLKNKMVTELNYSNFQKSWRWFHLDLGNIPKGNPVTHWMPLPKPPK